MSQESQIGVTGLAVMGANLARNIARHGVPGRRPQPHGGEDDASSWSEYGDEGDFTGGASRSRSSSPRSSARGGSSSWSRPARRSTA